MFREDYHVPVKQPDTCPPHAGEQDSRRHRSDSSAFVTRFLEKWGGEVRALREHYMDWLRESGRDRLRDERVYTFDILTLGVLWRQYGGRVRRVSLPAATLCRILARARRVWPALGPRLDPLHRRLATRFLAGGVADDGCDDAPSRGDLGALLRWMDATGEYREETRRLRLLASYLRGCIPEEREWYLTHALGIADAFMLLTQRELGIPARCVLLDHRGGSLHREGRGRLAEPDDQLLREIAVS